MPRSVPEKLRQLEADVQDLRVLPAADVRARGRRRQRRRTAGVLVGAAVVATTAGITATATLNRPLPAATAPTVPAPSCVLTLPSDPAAVRVRVLDGGAPAGQAARTTAGLRERGFTVLGRAEGTAEAPPGSASLRYGPAAIGAATWLRAVLIDDAVLRFDPARSGDTVDLTLGRTFTRLASPTEVNQALAAAVPPSAPPGC